jgi:nucleoside-diphosphate-sugar epimerase
MPSSVTNGTRAAYPQTRVRILISGASGLLGGRLAQLLSRRHDVIAGRHVGATPDGLESVSLDLRSRDSLRARARREPRRGRASFGRLRRRRPVANASPSTARQLNGLGTETLAALSWKRRARLIAISTDLVLSGERALGRREQPPRPIWNTAGPKLAGERAVLRASPDFAVLRIALLLGRGIGARSTASEGRVWALRAGRASGSSRPVPHARRSGLRRRRGAARARRSRRRLFQIGGPERLSRHALGLRCACRVRARRGPDRRDAAVRAADRRAASRGLLDGHPPRPTRAGWQPRPLDIALRESRQAPG